MCEKRCRFCAKASVVIEQYTETETTALATKGVVTNIVVDTQKSEPRAVFTRNCSRGGKTVVGYDKCISKLEFIPNYQ